VKEEVHGIYTQLYRLEGDPMMDGLLSLVHENINGHTQETMDTQFTKEEVKNNLVSDAPIEGPCGRWVHSRGFSTVLGTSDMKLVPVVLSLLNNGEWIHGANDTTIVLIPKVRHPQPITQF
jgi:hypothetical protein